jgi:hypothetical protein
MINIIALIVGLSASVGGCSLTLCRCYNQPQVIEREEHEQPIPPSRPNTPVPFYQIEHTIDDTVMEHMKEIVMEQLKSRDSDTDTEIDIKINIHTHHDESKIK